MATWSGTCSNRTFVWLAVIVPILMLALTVVLWDSSPAWVLIMNAVLAVVIFIALVVFSRLRVDVTQDAFVVRWGPTGWPVRTIPWSEIATVSLVDVDPWHWGGWGYRWAPGGRGAAAVVRGGPAIQLDLASGKRFTVTVDDADKGAAAAQDSLAHLRER